MFGYAVANPKLLSDSELNRYRSVYCGLCSALKRKFGYVGRLALTYDMTVLILVLSSLYNVEGAEKEIRCTARPLKKHLEWTSDITEYAADMNMLLALYNAEDDLRDEGGAASRIKAGLIIPKTVSLKEKYAAKCAVIEAELENLTKIEESGICLPDECASSFGSVMREIFSYKEDIWSETVSDMAYALGRFIYMLDACTDIKKDIRKNTYNPLKDMHGKKTSEEIKQLLEMLLGECSIKFEKLPIVNDASIIRNILYSGIWLKYDAAAGANER